MTTPTTRTRIRSRHGRSEARAAVRDERRVGIRVLLGRADRGVLSAPEAARLRRLVEAEIADCDNFRASAGGQQAAALRLHHRIAAAEQAIVETEADRDQLAGEVKALCSTTTGGDHR
ncbi:hypothetical protein [Streptomyces sp. MMS24-I29]|uniref:hypothetical protein n=1 Tax=Streptomyces sp. MMS24-I29 TaxID=3351480 RepID=UPI003C79CC88